MKPARHRLRALSRIGLLIDDLRKVLKHAAGKKYLSHDEIKCLHVADTALVELYEQLRKEAQDASGD